MNIAHFNSINPCTSCQMCGAVCPTQAISIELDEDGFYKPFVNNDKCINCELCIKTCYKFDCDIHISTKEELQRTTLYAASAIEDDIVNSTTSGGIGDILAKELIKNGYYVVGVAYEYETDRAIHKVAKSVEGTNVFRGSKYIQPYSITSFREVIHNIKYQKYAIFALPCQIYAISKYLEKKGKRKQCILVDLYCHGCPSMHVWDKTTNMIKQELNCEQFDEVNFRSKRRGWGNFIIEAKAAKRKYISSPLDNCFFDLFFSNQVLNQSCTNCKLRGTLSYSDIRLGDFWGKKYRKNTRGISGVSISTHEGEKIFEIIKPQISFVKESLENFLPYQSWNHTYSINEEMRTTLFVMLKDKSKDIYFISHYFNQQKSLKDKIKRIIKELLTLFPIKLAILFRR